MKRTHDKSRVSFRRKLVGAGGLFLFLVLVVASFFGERGLLDINRLKRQKQDLMGQKAELEEQRDILERKILDLENNPSAVSESARRDLGLVDPNEKVTIK